MSVVYLPKESAVKLADHLIERFNERSEERSRNMAKGPLPGTTRLNEHWEAGYNCALSDIEKAIGLPDNWMDEEPKR